MKSSLSSFNVTVVDRYAGRTDTGKVLRSRRRISWLLERRLGILRRAYEYNPGTLLSDGTVLRERVKLERGSLIDLRRDKPCQRRAPRAIYYADIFSASRAFGHIVESGLVEEPLAGRLAAAVGEIFEEFRENLAGRDKTALPAMDLSKLLEDIPTRLRNIHEIKAKARLTSCFYWPLDGRVAFLKVTDRLGRHNPGMLFLKIPAVLRELGRRQVKSAKIRPNFKDRLRVLTRKVAQVNELSGRIAGLAKFGPKAYKKSYNKKTLIARTRKLSGRAANLAIQPFTRSMSEISRGLDDCARRWKKSPAERIKHAEMVRVFSRAGIVKFANANLLISELASLVWAVSHWEALMYRPTADELAWLARELSNLRHRVKDLDSQGLAAEEAHTCNFGLSMMRRLVTQSEQTQGLSDFVTNVVRPVHDGLLALIDLLSVKREVIYFDQDLPLQVGKP